MVGQQEFRRVMGHFATGVTVVASRDPSGRPVGLTVNAFASVSLHPPLVLVCLHRKAHAHDPLLDAGHFGISILRSDQEDLALRFSRDGADIRFQDLPVRAGPLGSPLLAGALAWIECRIREVFPGGDHSIIVGEVMECIADQGDPLLFFRGKLGGLST